MPIIHLVGPNAVGKTTAVLRWGARYGGLVDVASLDELRKETGDGAAKREWLLKRSLGHIVVAESAWKDQIVRPGTRSGRIAERGEAGGDRVTVAESVYTNQIVQTRGLTVVSCDSESHGVILRGGERVEGYDLKGDVAEKARAMAGLREGGLAVSESARTTTAAMADPAEPVIVVTCPWEKLRDHLKARCAARKKAFREDYWDQRKCEYESTRRYLNFAAKYLHPGQWRHFVIADQARDWPAVDEYFGRLFRKIHNDLVRQAPAARAQG